MCTKQRCNESGLEYQNLTTLHSAIGFKQKKTISNSIFAEEVLDRYESAVFTSGNFVFGQSVYDKVLSNYSIPLTFNEYLALSDDKKLPIDNTVKQRTVARLIVKNSLNDRLRDHLTQTCSVSNSTCYPNTINEAVSLLSTFKKAAGNNNTNNNNSSSEDDVVVSCHVSEDNVNDT
jgi:hypothetical protein